LQKLDEKDFLFYNKIETFAQRLLKLTVLYKQLQK